MKFVELQVMYHSMLHHTVWVIACHDCGPGFNERGQRKDNKSETYTHSLHNVHSGGSPAVRSILLVSYTNRDLTITVIHSECSQSLYQFISSKNRNSIAIPLSQEPMWLLCLINTAKSSEKSPRLTTADNSKHIPDSSGQQKASNGHAETNTTT